MASNSDSIFYVLSYLRRHPEAFYFAKNKYDNVVQIFIKDDLQIADADIYFPQNRLMVNRLKDDFLAQHGNLLDHFWEQSGHQPSGYHEVWATSSHLIDSNVFLIELSYE